MDDDNETKRPAPFRDNRRATPKELRQVISRLKKRLRKEERRAEKVKALKRQINELAAQVNGYRNDPDLR